MSFRELPVRKTFTGLLICRGVAQQAQNGGEFERRIQCGEFKAHRGAWKWNFAWSRPGHGLVPGRHDEETALSHS